MPFERGKSGNPTGRPRGAENKIKKDLRGKITQFLLRNFEAVKDEVNRMESRDQIRFYIQLMPYGLSKLYTEEDTPELTIEELEEMLEKLKQVQEATPFTNNNG